MRRTMTRKGMAIEKLGTIILVAFFLGILFVGGFSLYRGEISSLDNLLPSFLRSNEIKGEKEILRYDIILDKVQYYKGAWWRDFVGGEVVLNGKKFFDKSNSIQGMISLEEDFRGFYFKKRKPVDLGEFKILRVQEVTTYISGTNDIQFESGDVIIEYNTFTNSGSPITLYFMLPWNDEELKFKDFNHQLFRQTNPIKDNLVLISWIRKNAMAFRDGVLEKPITINYYDIKNNPSGVNVCVKKYESRYLVVDLSKEVGKDGVCDG